MKNLGKECKDKVTGFTGIIISKIHYLTGCDQYGVTPPAKDGKILDTHYFDVDRIVVLKPKVELKEVTGKRRGGPNRDAPR